MTRIGTQNICGDMFALLSTWGKYELWWWPPLAWLPPIKKLVLRHEAGMPWWDIEPIDVIDVMATRPALSLCEAKWGLDVTTGLGVIHLGIDDGIGDWGIVDERLWLLGLPIFPVNESMDRHISYDQNSEHQLLAIHRQTERILFLLIVC